MRQQIKPSSRKLLLYAMGHKSDEEGHGTISYENFILWTGYSKTTVRRQLKELIKKNYCSTYKRYDDNGNELEDGYELLFSKYPVSEYLLSDAYLNSKEGTDDEAV